MHLIVTDVDHLKKTLAIMPGIEQARAVTQLNAGHASLFQFCCKTKYYPGSWWYLGWILGKKEVGSSFCLEEWLLDFLLRPFLPSHTFPFGHLELP